jgi:hypothetical protein
MARIIISSCEHLAWLLGASGDVSAARHFDDASRTRRATRLTARETIVERGIGVEAVIRHGFINKAVFGQQEQRQ